MHPNAWTWTPRACAVGECSYVRPPGLPVPNPTTRRRVSSTPTRFRNGAVAILTGLVLANCTGAKSEEPCAAGQTSGVAAERAKAQCLAEPALTRPTASATEKRDVILYLDRSASMQGFLDPEYPTRVKTDFRSVLDAVIAGLRPREVRSYGSGVAPASASIGVLGNKAFYQDRDTKMEEVIALIRKDTGELSSHLIIGDGRRGSPATADDQYVQLRDAAAKWVDAGGYFLVASSNAPFKTVESDPSGCRKATIGAEAAQTCPIYLFAFIPKDDAPRIASAVTDVFEHLYMWPTPGVPTGAVVLRPVQGLRKLNVNAIWGRAVDGSPIIRTSAHERTVTPNLFMIDVDTTAMWGKAYKHLLEGQETSISLFSRSLNGDRKQGWPPMTTAGLIRPAPSAPRTVDIASLGDGDANSLVRVDLVPTGQPSWLSLVEATDAKDAVRTYGIGRLFEMFRQGAKQSLPVPVARVYLVSN
jgi:hypothetical protein